MGQFSEANVTDEAPRAVHRPSASGIERSEACELSAVLPRPPEAPKAHNAPASRGDRIHKALERYSMGARWADVKHPLLPYDIHNLEEVCEKIPDLEPIEDWPLVEVEMWLNLMTGEAKLGTESVPVDVGFWRGRADMIGWYNHPEHGRIPAVVDHKTGNPNFQIDGGAKQLGYFIVGVHIMLEAPVIAGIAYLTQDPDHPRMHVWNVDEIVERFRGMRNHELRLAALERNGEMPAAVKGKWCTFCPVKSVCPAWAKKGSGDAVP